MANSKLILLTELNIGDISTLRIAQTIGKHNSSWGNSYKTSKRGGPRLPLRIQNQRNTYMGTLRTHKHYVYYAYFDLAQVLQLRP